MNPRRYLLLALASALLASGLTFDILARADRTTPVLVAARDVARFERIEGDDVKVISLPVRALHPKAAVNREEAVGRYALSDLTAGEQVLKNKLSGDVDDGRFLSRLAPNQRAFLVPVNLARSVGGAVRVGDRVDLIYVASEQVTGASLSRTIAWGLEVLDVRDERGAKAAEGAVDALPIGVIVAVSSEQAERIALAVENGQIYVALDGYEPVWAAGPGVYQEDLIAGP